MLKLLAMLATMLLANAAHAADDPAARKLLAPVDLGQDPFAEREAKREADAAAKKALEQQQQAAPKQ